MQALPGLGPRLPAAASWVAEDPLARAVLRTVFYFDVFAHPLRRAELTRLVAPGRPDQVDAAVDLLARRGVLAGSGSSVFKPGRQHGLARRDQRARHAERLWPLATLAAACLARVPFVRGVLITGGLSKGSTAPGDDVDFLLLVQPGRVWMLKTLLQTARKTWPGPVRELFCTNYLLATDKPLVDDRNIFTAVELATAVPVFGPSACAELLRANRWAQHFVPGWSWSVQRAESAQALPRPAVTKLVESACAGPLGASLERRSVATWDRYWNRKYAWLDADTRSQRFKRRADVATNHLHDFQGFVLGEVGRRLTAVGLAEPLELARGGNAVQVDVKVQINDPGPA